MKKPLLLLTLNLLLVTDIFACGCVGDAMSYVQDGQRHYNEEDQGMLDSFENLAKKANDNYKEFENISLQMFEENARIQYMEAVTYSNITFEADKMNELNSLEFDSQALKAKENSEVKIK